MEFVKYPKTPRLFRDIVITEKIDGTNAAISVTEEGEVYAQSRTRLITPDNDNFGFANWVYSTRDVWPDLLGPGLHFGEWWGRGIQRTYGMDTRAFSLFNSHRWADLSARVDGVSVLPVPVLYQGPFSEGQIADEVDRLARYGSRAAPGFPNPEGVIVYHSASRSVYKVLCENDEMPKGQVA